MNKNIDSYITSDLYLSSFLATVGCELVGLKKIGNKVFFEFLDQSYCKQLANSFSQDEWPDTDVRPLTFTETIKNFKARIFSLQNESERYL